MPRRQAFGQNAFSTKTEGMAGIVSDSGQKSVSAIFIQLQSIVSNCGTHSHNL